MLVELVKEKKLSCCTILILGILQNKNLLELDIDFGVIVLMKGQKENVFF